MNHFRPDIPPHVAEVIRSLHPDLKRSIKFAIRPLPLTQNAGSRSGGNSMGFENIVFVAFGSSMPSIKECGLFV